MDFAIRRRLPVHAASILSALIPFEVVYSSQIEVYSWFGYTLLGVTVELDTFGNSKSVS